MKLNVLVNLILELLMAQVWKYYSYILRLSSTVIGMLKRIVIIAVAILILMAPLLPYYPLPFKKIEGLIVIRHQPPAFLYKEHWETLLDPDEKPIMMETQLSFPLGGQALSRYMYDAFSRTTIIQVQIYETVSEQDPISKFEPNKTFVLLKFHRGDRKVYNATIESDGQHIYLQDSFECNDQTVLANVGRIPRSNQGLQPKLIIEDKVKSTALYYRSIAQLIGILEDLYAPGEEQHELRTCSYNRAFSKMIFNKLSSKKKWDWDCNYIENVQSSVMDRVLSVKESLGLRIGNLWAERIRYYLYPRLSFLDIDNLELLMNSPLKYESFKAGEFFIDLKTLNLLNDDTILDWKLDKEKLRSGKRDNKIFHIEKYRVPVATEFYVPFLSEYLLYHSFVVVGYNYYFTDYTFRGVREFHIRPVGNSKWISIEKYGKEIIIQSSYRKCDVLNKLRGEERMKTPFWREFYPELIEGFTGYRGNATFNQMLLSIWETNELEKSYHVFFDNCQRFANTIYDKFMILKEDFTPDLKMLTKDSEKTLWRLFMNIVSRFTLTFFRVALFFLNCAILINSLICLLSHIERRLVQLRRQCVLIGDIIYVYVIFSVLIFIFIVIAEEIALNLFWSLEQHLFPFLVGLQSPVELHCKDLSTILNQNSSNPVEIELFSSYKELTQILLQYGVVKWLYDFIVFVCFVLLFIERETIIWAKSFLINV